jgi:1-phosphofructokinase/tagatose 6-phosphate kinase
VIVTVTLNTAQDRTVSVPNFHMGGRNRAIQSLTLPGGKGVNVARALRRLGQPVIATGLAGGRVGTYITEELTAEGVLNDFVRISEESRTSTAVIDPTGVLQTEINEVGPSVNEVELSILHEKVRYLSSGADLFVIAGSLPPNVPPEIYTDLTELLVKRGVFTVIDAAGPPFRRAISAGPDLVSPNIREAEEIVGYEFNDDGDLVEGAKALIEMGAKAVLVHGEDGCVARLVPRDETRHRTYRAEFPTRTAVSTIGSGDSFLAGFLSAWLQKATPERALAQAVAAGAANSLKLGAGVFDLEDLEAFMRQVEVSVVE